MFSSLFSEGSVQSVRLCSDSNTIEVIRKFESNIMLLTNPPQQATCRVTKDIYGVVDGQITLVKTIQGKYSPEVCLEFVNGRFVPQLTGKEYVFFDSE